MPPDGRDDAGPAGEPPARSRARRRQHRGQADGRSAGVGALTHSPAARQDSETRRLDEADLERARAALAKVTHVVPHTDADGLASGAIVLRELGLSAADAVLLGRGQTPWSGEPA